MGSYCVTCAISGLPIHAGDIVIGWALNASPFGVTSGHGTAFNPTSLPVIGEYDTYGGIEPGDVEGGGTLEGDGMSAICHKSMWDAQIKAFDHKEFGGSPCLSLYDAFCTMHRNYEEDITRWKTLVADYIKRVEAGTQKAEDVDYYKRQCDPFEVAHRLLTAPVAGINFVWYLDKFTLGVPGKINTDKMPYEEIKKHKIEDTIGPFETMLHNLIINGCDKQTADLLQGLCMVYSTTYFRNRPILPNQMVPCTQYPEMKKELAWLKTVYEFGAKSHEERKREQKNDAARWARKLKKIKADEKKALAKSKKTATVQP